MDKSKKEPKYVETHFRLEPDTYERLRKFCFDNKISMSLVVRQAVEKYLNEAETNTP